MLWGKGTAAAVSTKASLYQMQAKLHMKPQPQTKLLQHSLNKCKALQGYRVYGVKHGFLQIFCPTHSLPSVFMVQTYSQQQPS